jgi:hypothetical protein
LPISFPGPFFLFDCEFRTALEIQARTTDIARWH